MSPLAAMDSLMLQKALELFSKVSGICMGLVALLFIMRAVYLQIKVSNSAAYAELFSDTVEFFLVITLFPYLVKLLMQLVSSIAKQITYGNPDVLEIVQNFLKNLAGDSIIVQIISKIGDIAIFIMVQGAYSVVMGILLAAAPLIFLLSTIFKISVGLVGYFQLLIALALWPIFWNLVGVLGTSFWPEFGKSPVRTVIFWGIIQFVQVTSPAICFALFRYGSMNVTQPGVEKVKRFFV